MSSRFLNIVLGLATVVMMSACNSDDIVEDFLDDIASGEISSVGDVTDDNEALSVLNKNHVIIIKYIKEEELNNATLNYRIAGVDVIRVSSTFGCEDFNLGDGETQDIGDYTLTTYELGGKDCMEFSYLNSDSHNEGNAHVALSYDNLD